MARRLEIGGGDWLRVSPKQVGVELVGAAIVAVLAGAAAVAAFLLGWGPAAVVPTAIFAITVITAVFIPRRVRSYGYQLRDDDLLFRRGLLFQRFVSVPYGRMQLVDITRGPVARALDLAELKLVTAAAATGVTIPGLRSEDADQLRERLVELAESRRVGL